MLETGEWGRWGGSTIRAMLQFYIRSDIWIRTCWVWGKMWPDFEKRISGRGSARAKVLGCRSQPGKPGTAEASVNWGRSSNWLMRPQREQGSSLCRACPAIIWTLTLKKAIDFIVQSGFPPQNWVERTENSHICFLDSPNFTLFLISCISVVHLLQQVDRYWHSIN